MTYVIAVELDEIIKLEIWVPFASLLHGETHQTNVVIDYVISEVHYFIGRFIYYFS